MVANGVWILNFSIKVVFDAASEGEYIGIIIFSFLGELCWDPTELVKVCAPIESIPIRWLFLPLTLNICTYLGLSAKCTVFVWRLRELNMRFVGYSLFNFCVLFIFLKNRWPRSCKVFLNYDLFEWSCTDSSPVTVLNIIRFSWLVCWYWICICS
jgi:hypothetical protein